MAFPQPEEFIPDRWENETSEMRTLWTVFGSGPRICIGEKYVTSLITKVPIMGDHESNEFRQSGNDGDADDACTAVQKLRACAGTRDRYEDYRVLAEEHEGW